MSKGNYSDKDWLINLPEAYAYHQIIVDQQGKPVDYVFLQVNPAFEEMTGLRREDILGRRVREVMPSIVTGSFNWIDAFGDVAQTGKKQYFKQYSQPLGRWYSVTAYSDEPGYFSVLFHDITIQQKEKENLQTILESTNRFLEEEGTIDHQQLVEDMKVITGASYVAFHLFDENGKEFTTMAIAGISKNVTKASQILGFNLIGRKWAYDPVRQKKISKSTITSFQNLKELSGEMIPEAILGLLEKKFQIGQVTVINIKKKEKLIGDFTVLMAADKSFMNQEMALFYANQTGLFLDREKAMNQLRNQQDLFMAGPVFTITWSPENMDRVM
ncbi:PAS domain S-box protein [Tindallia californiensis]|uniref:PAS domain S-box-containing protein n=1 Tax=Tindallia californiensis TaxID=159292 RepID=A0A1H3KGE8_9FIRM|nr:PAS domain S-box protein [Tindallia californiensis]SDY51176.1 PAS domain S-box-containing protein [Tindallia californiensis]